jgi:4-amino-4-deoxy-L-arabinose transferase-like glycosyltransferase
MSFFKQACRFCERFIWGSFGLVAVVVLFSIARFAADETFARHLPVLSCISGLIVAVCALLALHTWGKALVSLQSRASAMCGKMSLGAFLLLCVSAGIAIRLVWVMFFPAPLHADGLHYFRLASELAQGHEYRSETGALAYWPPGYPFTLYVGMKLFGLHTWVVTLVNLLFFGVSVLLVYSLARRIADDEAGRLSALMLVIWPNYIASVGLGSKEMVVVPCLLATLLFFFRARSVSNISNSVVLSLAAGIILGFASLTHPSFQLFPIVLIAYEWLSACTRWGYLRLAVLLTGMALVVFPWTLRNHHKLGQWVLISDNGGDVFYRANNAKASGGYEPQGETPLPYDEVQRDRVGYRLGEEWIVSHPGRFLALAERKLTFFLGDDGVGVFESVKRGLGITGTSYFLLRAIANGYWFLIWLSILNTLQLRWKSATSLGPELLTLILSFLFLLPIHSLFETDSRHHVPVIGALAALAAVLLCSLRGEQQIGIAISEQASGGQNGTVEMTSTKLGHVGSFQGMSR